MGRYSEQNHSPVQRKDNLVPSRERVHYRRDRSQAIQEFGIRAENSLLKGQIKASYFRNIVMQPMLDM